MQRCLVVAAFVSVVFFVGRGYLVPLAKALNDSGSFIDFRGPYFGAFDLRFGEVVYPYNPKFGVEATRIAHQYGLSREETLYFPLFHALYIPLTFLKLPLAKALWLSLNFFLVGPVLWLLLRITNAKIRYSTPLAILIICSFLPLIRALDSGQNTILILTLLLLAVYSLQLGKTVRAGAMIALASIIKPIPLVLFIGLLLGRRWKVVVSGTVTLSICVAASVLLFGVDPHLSFLQVVMREAQVNVWWSRQSLRSLFMILLTAHPSNTERTPWVDMPELAWSLWGASVIVLLAVSTLVTIKRMDAGHETFSIWLVTGLLISPQVLDYYMVWLLIPLVCFIWRLINEKRQTLLLGAILSYCLLEVPGVKFSSLPLFHQGPLLVLAHAQTLGMLLLYALMVIDRLHRTIQRSPTN